MAGQNEMTPEQMKMEIERLQAELADKEQHVSTLQNMRREQSNRARGLSSLKKNHGYRVVHFKEIRQCKTETGNDAIKNVFFVLIETPWPASLPYDTVEKMWRKEAESVLATLGYEEYYPDGRHVSLRERFLPKLHPAIDHIAFYDSISYRADSYYTISFYAGSAPKIPFGDN